LTFRHTTLSPRKGNDRCDRPMGIDACTHSTGIEGWLSGTLTMGQVQEEADAMSIVDTLHRWRLRAGFRWAQSTDSQVVAARTWLDTRVLSWGSVTSTAGPDAPSVACLGVPLAVAGIHQMVEERREALGAVTDIRVRDRISRDALLRGADLPAADLVAVVGSAAQVGTFPRGSALTLPLRMHILARTEDGGDGWRRRMSKSERRWSHAYRESGSWALEVADDLASFDFFYDRIHVPTMRARHGDRAISETRATARECLFRDGVLAFVTHDGVRVAGMLCHWEPRKRILTIRLVGVLDGLSEHYDDGAMRTSDHLLLEWASNKGVRHVDFGGCGPFLSAGIFQWKRKIAPSAILAPTHHGSLRVWWHARRDTPAVRDFLVANPVTELVDGRALRAVYFYDEQRPARLDIATTREGFEDHRVLALDEFFSRQPQPTSAR
jgi:hypothetical protein